MNRNGAARFLLLSLLLWGLSGCDTGEPPVNVEAVLKEPKRYVGSDTCKLCHLEHYDSWKMTLHSRTLQNVQQNIDALVTEIDDQRIREDLAKLGDRVALPVEEVYVPKVEEIRWTIGTQWRQRYIVEKDGTLFVAPVQYNIDRGMWTDYHEEAWDTLPFLLKCGGCHATGVNFEERTFMEPAVGCEACHGKGSWHAALPKTAIFEKRQTIVNPAKLTLGIAVQICGSCHARGASTKMADAGWPVGFEPGKALQSYFRTTSFWQGSIGDFFISELTHGHHQQYNSWIQSSHFMEGVTCTSCHYVHQIGLPPTRSQTIVAGSKQCLSCHQVVNNVLAHSIHSFGNCVGCHMPRVIPSAESGHLHSHVFATLLPRDTLANPAVPNSCQSCHEHRKQDLNKLHSAYDALTVLPRPLGSPIPPIDLQ